jgi:hypothetical protein
MMTSGMIRGRWHCATVLACCLGAAVLQPGAIQAQAPDDAAQREKQIVELKATIDQLIKDAADTASGETQKIIKLKVDELGAALAEVAKAEEIGARVAQAIQAEHKAKAATIAQAANVAAQSQQQLGVILNDQKAEMEKAVADQLLAQAKLQKLAEIQIGDDGKLAADKLKLVQAKLQKLGQQTAGDRQGLQAELKEAEMKLEQATRQAQELKARIKEITAKMKAEAAAAAKSAASKEDSRIQLRLNLTTPDATEELLLRKVNGKWEVVPASKGDQSRRSSGQRIEASPAPGRKITVMPKTPEGQGGAALKFRVDTKTPPAAAGSNARIDALEKKIDKALQQVEQLRKQMNSRGKSGGRPEED